MGSKNNGLKLISLIKIPSFLSQLSLINCNLK